MSTHERIELQCDVCEVEWHQCLSEHPADARDEAKNEGWAHVDGKDVGPNCIENPPKGRKGAVARKAAAVLASEVK